MSYLLRIFTANPMALIWTALGIAVVAGGAGAYGGWTLSTWKSAGELATCKGDLARVRDANEAFGVAIKQQTQAIMDVAEATRSRAAQAAVAEAAARKQGNMILGKADAILTRPLPATAAEDCAALSIDLDGEITERKRRAP